MGNLLTGQGINRAEQGRGINIAGEGIGYGSRSSKMTPHSLTNFEIQKYIKMSLD